MINIGVLGCANIAERYIIPTVNELNEYFNLIGVSSRKKNKADSFSEKFNAKAFYSYDDLLISKDLQAIYIPLPNSLHYKWVKKSLKKGIHVLVEKSLTCSYSQVIELNLFAKKNKLVLLENFQFRFHSQLEYIRTLVSNNKIGELRNVKASFGFPPFEDKENIRYKQQLGGGALLDAGAYTIKISQFFLGSDVKVQSARLHFDKNYHIDTWGSGHLVQINGSLSSQISFGFDNYYQCSLELWGSKGKIYTNRIFTSPPEFKPTLVVHTADRGKEIINLNEDNHFKNMLLYFFNLISNKKYSKNIEKEYEENNIQAKLISEFMCKGRMV